MPALVGYDSSDEEDGMRREKPAKIPKHDSGSSQATSQISNGAVSNDHLTGELLADAKQAYTRTAGHQDGTATADPAIVAEASQPTALSPGPALGPAAIPVTEPLPTAAPVDANDPPLSPYTFERQRVRELTMPPIPNFDIPGSPSPPPTNSADAASLAATTKKFDRFLDLKKQGVHFHDRLRSSSSLRNPSLLPKLMEFAGISAEESYASSLPEGVGVPVRWPEEGYVESLVKVNERKEKKREAERDRVDFVPAMSKSAATSARSTPGAPNVEHRKSRFDRK